MTPVCWQSNLADGHQVSIYCGHSYTINSVNTQKQKTTEVCIPLTHLFSLLAALTRSQCGGARCRCKIPAAPRPSPSPSCVGSRDPPLISQPISPFPFSPGAGAQALGAAGRSGAVSLGLGGDGRGGCGLRAAPARPAGQGPQRCLPG